MHAICPEGRRAAREKLAGMAAAFVPYAKPGLPLTREILSQAQPETQVFVLANHGLIICANTVDAADALTEELEERLALPARHIAAATPSAAPPDGYVWADERWIARDARACNIATGGSYYPDHVVFLGSALPTTDPDSERPALMIEKVGIALRASATPSQRAMLRCLSDVLSRLPEGWTPEAIGTLAEAELLNWDAEKYRQALAARS